MNSIIKRSATPLGALIVSFILLFFLVLSTIVANVNATDGKGSLEGRILTIHDGDTSRVIITQANTIGEALSEAGVVMESSDAVEPAASEVLVASEYDVNIYRARPVVVIDGLTKSRIITPYQSAKKIAVSAGITLYDGDLTVLTKSEDIVSDGAGLILTIVRATPFSFTLYGKTNELRTQAKTVGDMLKEKGISLSSDDKLSPSIDSAISPNMSIRVWREGSQTVTVDEAINFEVEKIQDGDRYVGYNEVKTAGQNGSRSVTYEITIQDGQEVGRREIASITTKEPVKQVEIVGVKNKGSYTTPTENETITWDFLIKNGFTRIQTAGIMGNLMQEHRFNTDGDGLAQWTGSRKQSLLSRPDPYNIYTQLDFLMYELNTSKVKVLNNIKSTNNLEEVTIIFQNQFEVCNPAYCMQSQRINYAYNILASH